MAVYICVRAHACIARGAAAFARVAALSSALVRFGRLPEMPLCVCTYTEI